MRMNPAVLVSALLMACSMEEGILETWASLENEQAASLERTTDACDLREPIMTCWFSPESGESWCDDIGPLDFYEDGRGVDIDLANAEGLALDVLLDNPTGHVWSIGNSPSNNGWSGDAGDTVHDSELQLYNGTVNAWGNDHVDGEQQLGLKTDRRWSRATVCHQASTVWSGSGGVSHEGHGLFNLHGDEADLESTLNDTWVHMSLNSTPTGSRSGSGATLARLQLY